MGWVIFAMPIHRQIMLKRKRKVKNLISILLYRYFPDLKGFLWTPYSLFVNVFLLNTSFSVSCFKKKMKNEREESKDVRIFSIFSFTVFFRL